MQLPSSDLRMDRHSLIYYAWRIDCKNCLRYKSDLRRLRFNLRRFRCNLRRFRCNLRRLIFNLRRFRFNLRRFRFNLRRFRFNLRRLRFNLRRFRCNLRLMKLFVGGWAETRLTLQPQASEMHSDCIVDIWDCIWKEKLNLKLLRSDVNLRRFSSFFFFF